MSAGTHTGDGTVELSWREPVAATPQAAETTTRLRVRPHTVRTRGTATLRARVISSAGTPEGTVVFRRGPSKRIVGTATLVHGVARLKVAAGKRPGIRHFVATYRGTPSFAPSTSRHVRLIVKRRAAALPAVLPNTGARHAIRP
jgi:hypothetical protein